ncbi:50S ribosomal protein L39e [Candidatus Woesearchaeota archaeon]|nr:50S ribosomal protein L39e [Candidatus Woesearchaeota archaeon]
MSKVTTARKKRLAKLGRQTKWAPVWIIPRIFGVAKKVHPSKFTTVKRSWRRHTKTKV